MLIYMNVYQAYIQVIVIVVVRQSRVAVQLRIEESETESSVTLTVVSHWADFDKKSGRQTNNNSQQRFFNTDVGMDFSSQTVLDIKWGRP